MCRQIPAVYEGISLPGEIYEHNTDKDSFYILVDMPLAQNLLPSYKTSIQILLTVQELEPE